MTLEHGLMRTCRFPRFSALLMHFRASARTFMRTMMPTENTMRDEETNFSKHFQKSRKGTASTRLSINNAHTKIKQSQHPSIE